MSPQSEEPWELSEQARQAKSGLPGYIHLLEPSSPPVQIIISGSDRDLVREIL